MWVDSNDVRHSVALPDPTDLMSANFEAALCRLVEHSGQSVSEAIEREYEELLETPVSAEDLRATSGLEGCAPPVEILDGTPQYLGELVDCVRAVEIEWRLDAIHAIQDYVDELMDGGPRGMRDAFSRTVSLIRRLGSLVSSRFAAV